MTLSQESLIEELKTQWKKLWQERLDDKVRAEGVALKDYSSLFVEKGTIIQATKDYKALNLREIIEKHQIQNPDRHISPNPQVGGLTKFIKMNILNKKLQKHNQKICASNKKNKKQQPKNGGRGWLHK